MSPDVVNASKERVLLVWPITESMAGVVLSGAFFHKGGWYGSFPIGIEELQRRDVRIGDRVMVVSGGDDAPVIDCVLFAERDGSEYVPNFSRPVGNVSPGDWDITLSDGCFATDDKDTWLAGLLCSGRNLFASKDPSEVMANILMSRAAKEMHELLKEFVAHSERTFGTPTRDDGSDGILARAVRLIAKAEGRLP